MPEPAKVLEGLSFLTNQYAANAVAWHFVLLAIFISLGVGWRPSRRAGGLLLPFLLLSVAVLAFLGGNPFNGTVFALLTLALAAIGSRLPVEKIPKSPGWSVIAGAVMGLFGCFYPHFVAGTSWTRYLYRAPVGLIPCPTLSLAVGVALIAAGFGSRAYAVVLAAAGIFYGLFGVVRLGVRIDAVLAAGAILLLVKTLTSRPAAAPAPEIEAGPGL
jgi:hypothetical protein